MVSVVEISPDKAQAVLSLSEGHFQDLKAIEIRPAKLTKSVSAFANTAGGELHTVLTKLQTAVSGGGLSILKQQTRIYT